jgi:hypothetical protein
VRATRSGNDTRDGRILTHGCRSREDPRSAPPNPLPVCLTGSPGCTLFGWLVSTVRLLPPAMRSPPETTTSCTPGVAPPRPVVPVSGLLRLGAHRCPVRGRPRPRTRARNRARAHRGDRGQRDPATAVARRRPTGHRRPPPDPPACGRAACAATGSGRHHPAVVVTDVCRRPAADWVGPVAAAVGAGAAAHGGVGATSIIRYGPRSASGDRWRLVVSAPPSRGGRRAPGLLAAVGVVHGVRLADPSGRSPSPNAAIFPGHAALSGRPAPPRPLSRPTLRPGGRSTRVPPGGPPSPAAL